MSDRRSWNVLLSHPAVRYPDVKCRRTEFRMWNVGGRNSGCEMSEHGIPPRVDWAMLPKGDREALKDIRINSIRIPQEDMWRAPLSELPQGEAHNTHEHHTRTIAYPIRICCPDHWLNVSKPCFIIRTACHRPCSVAIRWCVWTPCPDIFAMDSKELSLISDCFGDKKAIKTPKLNTILIRIDCKGP